MTAEDANIGAAAGNVCQGLMPDSQLFRRFSRAPLHLAAASIHFV
jgi:hypothetical protein